MDRYETRVEFNILVSRLKELESNLLKIEYDTIGFDLTNIQDNIGGYILLCHAEIENYFEELANEIIDNALQDWKKNQISNYNLTSLLVSSKKVEKNNNDDELFVNRKIHKCISGYKELINKNHGIKSININLIFNLIGYHESCFDVSFMATLNSFGEKRGGMAHKSVSSTQNMLDPKSEISNMKLIIQGIETFEKIILTKPFLLADYK